MSEQTELPIGDVDMATAIANAPDDVCDDKWPKLLAEIVDVLVALYGRRGRTLEAAIEEARAVAVSIAQLSGGRPFYLPRGDRLVLALRDREIYLRHTRDNTNALAAEFNLTTRQIQSIVARQHAIQVRRRQGQLFSEGDAR